MGASLLALAKSILDNIFVNNIEENYILSGILYTDLSDHLPLFQILSNITKERKPNIQYEYRQVNKGT